ncbi:hypothetical protein MLD38_018570 [Melastoma candidum]|uniref:Uncharacterized protein n=1 Tax=Melastoma candidum TaxID=119954 RepID=A0ACB9QW53_9MYRT|nr:hypothetical protein MLD38_018570 [Melastoma candidum]
MGIWAELFIGPRPIYTPPLPPTLLLLLVVSGALSEVPAVIGADTHADSMNEKEGVVVTDADREKEGVAVSGSELKARVDAMWGQMNKGVDNHVLLSLCKKPASVSHKPKRKASANWMNYLGLVEPKREDSTPTKRPEEDQEASGVVTQNNSSDETKRLAAAALCAVKEAAVAAAGKGKVEITEIRDFAGQDIEVKKLVDADVKEAADKTKASSSSAVDAVLEQIKKKQKLSVLDKTKKDWGEYKDENKGMEEELDAYKKSSNQYLDKVSFLQRADYREFERERDARLALQARRRPDMREEP